MRIIIKWLWNIVTELMFCILSMSDYGEQTLLLINEVSRLIIAW